MAKNKLALAISVTASAFADKKDKGGEPYILHCLYVMNEVKHLPEVVRIAAVLHDIVEDTHWTHRNIASHFGQDVGHLVGLLTHEKNETYRQYINRVKTSQYAMIIKMADLKHNSSITRMKGVRDKDFERIKKYNLIYNEIDQELKLLG